VWGKSIKTNKERIRKQIKELWFYVEKIYAEEQMLPNQANFEEIDPEKVAQAIYTINEELKDKKIDEKLSKS
jgi:hypothetical protein